MTNALLRTRRRESSRSVRVAKTNLKAVVAPAAIKTLSDTSTTEMPENSPPIPSQDTSVPKISIVFPETMNVKFEIGEVIVEAPKTPIATFVVARTVLPRMLYVPPHPGAALIVPGEFATRMKPAFSVVSTNELS